jgi:NAD(P)-dependent dehydrogenase (short-subunit alcohol dehydrogenase family)
MSVKTTVITGPTSGIGKETAMQLAKLDHALHLLVRDTEKGEQLKQEIITQTGNQSIFVIRCDLADLQSVSEAADQLKAKLFNINILINNAGGIFKNLELSKDGFEMTFAANYLGHFALTMHLMPLLERGHARIINVSSQAYKMGKADFDNLRGEKSYSDYKSYGTAKLFNIYFTQSLADRYASKGITAYSLYPGIVKTNFGAELSSFGKFLLWISKPFMITPEEGAKTSVYLATEPKIEKKTGNYFIKCKKSRLYGRGDDYAARNQLWSISHQLIGSEKEKMDV